MKKIAQIQVNLPTDRTSNLISNYPAVSRLGIWGPPGTRLDFNGGTLILNEYGIYELDLMNIDAVVTEIKEATTNDTSGQLFIDVIYEAGGNAE